MGGSENEGQELTLATEQHRQIPQLGHIERLKHLSLITRPIAIQTNSRVILAHILVREPNARTHRHLRTHNPVPTIEPRAEHVHAPALAVRNAIAPAEQLANDRLDRAAAHEREAMAAVGGDEVVLLCEGVLDADCDGFLAGGEMAEAADFLFFVQAVGGHFHAAGGRRGRC